MGSRGVEEEIGILLKALVRGETNPESAADWALEMMGSDDPKVGEPRIWTALDRLAGADLKTGPSSYLHDVTDFEVWLADFEEGGR